MTQHYPRGTAEASHYCSTCDRFTRHRIDFPLGGRRGGGKVGPCLECLGFVIGNCRFPEQPECAHCDKPFPQTTKSERTGDHVVLHCPSCGCMTPFAIDHEAAMSKKQLAAKAKREKAQQQPSLFEAK